MDTQVDFSIYDQTGKLTAVAEAKKKPGITRTWATNWARNFLAHGGRRSPVYLLLATPEHVYLWKRPVESEVTEPTYTFDSKVLFQSYFSRPEVDPQQISPQAFELLVGSWLHDLMQKAWATSDEEAEPLAQSGFLEAVKHGHVESDQRQ